MKDGRYVYVIGPREGPFKLGIATNVASRRSIANVGNWVYLFIHYEYAAESEAQAQKIERELHFHFRDRHIRGEWFRLTPDDLGEIQTLMNMSNFVDTAPDDWSLQRKTDEEFTGLVCRRARGALSLTREELASAASVSVSVLEQFEEGCKVPITRTLEALRAALEAQGVEFVPRGPDQPLRILI